VFTPYQRSISDKIINNCPDYFDYDNTGDFDGSIFIFVLE